MITHPQAVRFCNEVARRTADRYSQLYWTAKAFLQEWTANNLGAILPNTADVVDDGAAVDGRSAMTSAMVNGLKTNLQLFVNDLEANGNVKLNALSQIAVNDLP